ncbi:MAG TPA: lipoyl synthase, partial [Desulfohalobiaceae bacterium]|nr:lipoyl synthase [Desulfohalobiaceae bacterium]
DEIETVLNDLVRHGCSMLTIGQYLQPSPSHLPVKRYLWPDEFAFWKKRALDKGFLEVASGPLVRSSYKAKEMYLSLINYKL